MAIGGISNVFLGQYDSRDLDIQVVTQEQAVIANFMAEYMAQYERMNAEWRANFLGRQTTNHVEAYFGTTSGRMQRADQYSRPDLVRQAPPKYYQYYPLNRFEDGTGWTDDYLDRATLRDLANDAISQAQRDQNNILWEAMRALLRKDSYTFQDEIQGPLTIRPFLNGDGSLTPPERVSASGSAFDGTHTHYWGTNNATLAQSHLQTIKDHLTHHGYEQDLVLWIASNLQDEVEGMTDFAPLPDPLVRTEFTAARFAVGVTDPDAIGRVLGFEVAVKPHMPDDYMFAWSRAVGPPLLERISDLPQRRGLRIVAQERSYPLRNSMWERRFGFAPYNRINGVAVQVVASATYTNPTAYGF